MDYYFFLSNFYLHTIEYPYLNSKSGSWLTSPNKKWYRSVEHAYQAFKADNDAEHEYIRNLDTASKAKKAGKNVSMRKDWESIKYNLMFDLLRVKFDNIELANKLIDTGDDILIEGNYWHDNLWGDCTCEKCKDIVGKNWLGEQLMIIREEVKKARIEIEKGWEELKNFSLDLCTPAKLSIYNAMMEVEKAGSDIKLIEAVNKLKEARYLIANYIDSTLSTKISS